jgi:toxin ParE1/3/4
MAKPFRLSPQAERSMADIGAWTVGRFGDEQAERYLEKLISRCVALSEDRLPHRSCRDHFAPDLRDDLRFISAGRHFVIFVEAPAELRILDFIHQSANVGGWLKELPE